MDRFVWIDIMSVRQWPGNVSDLNFREIIPLCKALVVAAAPIKGVITDKWMDWEEHEVYLSSADYSAAKKSLPFARLWCIGEAASFRLSTSNQFLIPLQ